MYIVYSVAKDSLFIDSVCPRLSPTRAGGGGGGGGGGGSTFSYITLTIKGILSHLLVHSFIVFLVSEINPI